MTVSIICEKNNFMGKIGFDTDVVNGLTLYGNSLGMIHVQHVVDFEELIKLRDKLLEMFPIEEKTEGVPEWRRAGEWKEVELEEAREGDYAEFDHITCNHVVCCLTEWRNTLIADMSKVIVGNLNVSICYVRNYNCRIGECVKNLHIWRKLDPHRFDEPKDEGYYATQSGVILYNDGDSHGNWHTKANTHTMLNFTSWDYVLENLSKSEFPLVKLTPEILRKAVEE